MIDTPSNDTVGIDSGHEGEGEHSSSSSSSSDSEDPVEQEEREELRWKKGKLLGRGAYGKVYTNINVVIIAIIVIVVVVVVVRFLRDYWILQS